MNPAVSIVVPVYNAERYLGECLESLCNQTLNNIEIIAVNDGSTDSSRDILEEYRQRFTNFTIIDKEKAGVSDARNRGIKCAGGDYIGFVDSDDWVEPTMFEEMHSAAIRDNADIAVCRVRKCFDKKKPSGGMDLSLFEQYRGGFHWREVIQNIPFLRAYSYNKIYRRKLIEEHNITFQDTRIHTDNLFMYASLTAAEKILCINKDFYYYRIHRDGQVTALADDRVFDVFKTYELLENYLKEKGIYPELKEQVTKRKLEEYLRDFRKIKDNKEIRKPYFKRMHKELQKTELNDDLLSPFPRRRRHILKLAKRNASYHSLAALLL